MRRDLHRLEFRRGVTLPPDNSAETAQKNSTSEHAAEYCFMAIRCHVDCLHPGQENCNMTILLDPHPRTVPLIFSEQDRQRLESLGRVLYPESQRVSDAFIDWNLSQITALIG